MQLITFIFLFALSIIGPVAAQSTITVVIDPGHGGKDPGHLSHNPSLLPEKDLNLKIAQYLGGYIEKYLQHVNVVYTRTTDTYPSLDERVAIANKYQADYFISIHCNGNERTSVRGTETHVHSFDFKKSVALAVQIEKQFSSRAGRHSRGVKDGKDRAHSIQVLKYTPMTSVLVECGFLTNTSEANYLNTSNGQEIIASAIFRGFRTFIQKQHPSIDFVRKTPSGSGSGTYTIQILSSIDPIDTESAHFRKMPGTVTRTQLNTTNAYKYRYTVGQYATRAAAQSDLKKIQKSGYRDAFIIALE